MLVSILLGLFVLKLDIATIPTAPLPLLPFYQPAQVSKKDQLTGSDLKLCFEMIKLHKT